MASKVIFQISQKLEYNFYRNMKTFPIIFALLLAFGSSLACTQGSVANPANICISPNYIEGCYQYLSEFQCKVCNYRYMLSQNGLCEIDLENTEDCCSKRASDKSCITCKPGLYLIDGKCQESNILGCLEKDNKGICLNCASDFYLVNGICKKAIKNCLSYADQTKTTCTECLKSFSLISNFCVQNSILGCKNEVNHICKECYDPYILSNGNCEINNCKSYDQYKCIACNCGYFLTLQGDCKQNALGCVRYQRGQCTDCLPGFRLKGNVCDMQGCVSMSADLTCSQCKANYTKVNGVCQMINCLSWKDDNCLICSSGFNYQLGKCIAQPSAINTE